GVEGKAKVKVRTYTKDGEERQSNEVTAFELKSRPNLILPGGAPTITPTQTTAPVQSAQPSAPTFVQVPAGAAPQPTTPQPTQPVDEVAELRAKLEAAEAAAAAKSKTPQPTTAAAGVARDHPDPGF